MVYDPLRAQEMRAAKTGNGARVLLERTKPMELAAANSAPAVPSSPLAQQPEPSRPRRYALITPCRDESKYARRTLDAVLNQTARPALWVIVDDGSKDQT